MADPRPQPSAEPVGDLIERIVVRAGKCGHHFDPNCEGCLAANRWTNEQLDEQRSRIAALEAENARLIGDLADTKAEYHRVSEVSLELAKDKARLREALEQFLSLIEYQYCGSREAMNALQEADNSARAALGEKQ